MAPTPLRILIVDDDHASAEALATVVRSLGYAVSTARGGGEAWALQQREHADIVLSDWDMPGVDGIELCRRIRAADGEGAYTYFIFMTGFADRQHFLRGMQAGADDYQTKPVDIDELQARLASASRVLSLHHALAARNRALQHDSDVSFRQARLDALTGAGNRLRMNEDLQTVWARATRYGHHYSVAICDIDQFKAYNDHHGHLAGDEVIRRVADTIRSELRQGDEVYCYGGEEFLVVLPEQSREAAMRAVERVRAAVGALGDVTLSAGVAELAKGDAAIESALARADAALYRAKAEGRNRVMAA
jgi:two-component system chemotaxis response regulator CheY